MADPSLLMAHLSKSDDYIQLWVTLLFKFVHKYLNTKYSASQTLINIMSKWYGSINFQNANSVDVSQLNGFPFPISQDGSRVSFEFQPNNGSPWISSYGNDNFTAKYLEDFIKDQLASNYDNVVLGKFRHPTSNWSG